MKEWKIERIGEGYYAIFHREENREWEDEFGDNLCFSTKAEALRYLEEKTKNDLPI